MDKSKSSEPDVAEVRRSPFSFEVIDEQTPVAPPPNKQLFENNELSHDPVVEAERNDPDRLFSSNDKVHCHDKPNLAVIHEKPEHRLIVYLKAQGLSNKEVADRTGYTPPWISQLTRQPWFRLRLVQELKDAGVDELMSVLKSTALDSIFTIIDIRDDAHAPKAVRSACANSLLDRYLGKATTKVEVDDKRMPSTPEISALDAELKQIDKELNSSNGNRH